MTPSTDPRDAKIAALLEGSYELLGHLGRGGFATVYRVRNRRLNRVEALKVLSADLEEPDFAERFRQEARLAASLDHPHIVKIFDYGQGDDLCWFTMQLVDGPTLIRELKQKGPWNEADAASLAAAICDALDYSHRRGIIHRDIKPENILVDTERHPYLMDFGIAKSDQSVVHTRTGTILGSPAYIAPEQLTGGAVDGRADLYALGATLYRMVSNSFPFQDSDPVRMAMKRFTMAPEPLGPKRPGIDPVFESIVMRALERDPAARFATAGDMEAALRAFLAGKPVLLPPAAADAFPPAPEPGTPYGFSLPAGGAAADSQPTVRTAPPSPALAPPPSVARRAAWPVAGGLVLAAAVAAWLYGRAVAPGPATAAAPVPVPVFTSASSAPTAAPASASFSATPPGRPTEPAAEPSPAPRAAERSAPPRPAVRRPAPANPPIVKAAAAPARRAVSPPETESAPDLEISPQIAREFANRSVGLRVTVAEDGSVRDARVISPVCPECDRAARAAILRYRFRPARDAEGKPVQSVVGVPVIIPAPD
ncbi:MAG: protein kinase [Acidobacteriota bacterium]